MSGKDVWLHELILSLVLSFLLLGLSTNAVGIFIPNLVVLLFLLSSVLISTGGIFSSPSGKLVVLELLFLSLTVFVSARIRIMTNANLGVSSSRIFHLEGRVVYDSSVSSNGNHIMRILLSGCSTLSGDRCSASGLVSALGKEKQIISSGTVVRLGGRFSDDLFIYDSIQVMERSRLNIIREYLIPVLEHRLVSEGDEASVLSTLLLFGRSDYFGFPMRELAQNCGCSHILALSGMHLGIMVSASRKIFGDGKIGKAVSFVLVFAFVFIAGPRPSLVRAALTFTLASLAFRNRLFLVFLIQMILFPVSMAESGSCYGYVAVFAIVYICPVVEAVLFQYIGKTSKIISASISVLVLSAPVQMMLTGSWHPAAIAASPVAGLLAACSMIIGLFVLAFGRTACLMQLNSVVHDALKSLFEFFGTWPSSGWAGYVVFLSLLTISFLLTVIVRAFMRKRCESNLTVRNLLRIIGSEE